VHETLTTLIKTYRKVQLKSSNLVYTMPRGFIAILSRSATGFHRQAKLFELQNIFIVKTFH